MITGVIDVGSNTIRLSVFEYGSDGSFESLISKKSIAGLASYIVHDELSAKGERKLCRSLEEFQRIINAFGVKDVHAFATASLRYVNNAKEVIRRVYEETKLPLQLLSGKEEARLSFLGAKYSTGIQEGLVVDIGGASCELIEVSGKKACNLMSLPLGCLSLNVKTESGIVPHQNSIDLMHTEIAHQLKYAKELFKKKPHTLCFVGGTARASYRIAREMETGGGRSIKEREIKQILRGFARQDYTIMEAVRSVAPERVFTLFSGMLIMQAIMKASGAEDLLVSSCGVREGYLIDKIIRN